MDHRQQEAVTSSETGNKVQEKGRSDQEQKQPKYEL